MDLKLCQRWLVRLKETFERLLRKPKSKVQPSFLSINSTQLLQTEKRLVDKSKEELFLNC